FMDGMGLAARKLKIAFGPNDGVGGGVVEAGERGEGGGGGVREGVGGGLRDNLIEREDIGNSGVSDIDEYRNGSLNIDHRVQFYAAVTIAGRGPRKQRQT